MNTTGNWSLVDTASQMGKVKFSLSKYEDKEGEFQLSKLWKEKTKKMQQLDVYY